MKVPKLIDILADTNASVQRITGVKSPARDRYGSAVFVEALRANVMLTMLAWAADEPTLQADGDIKGLIEVMERLITATYRSQ